jgi:hypothetical protein
MQIYLRKKHTASTKVKILLHTSLRMIAQRPLDNGSRFLGAWATARRVSWLSGPPAVSAAVVLWRLVFLFVFGMLSPNLPPCYPEAVRGRCCLGVLRCFCVWWFF